MADLGTVGIRAPLALTRSDLPLSSAASGAITARKEPIKFYALWMPFWVTTPPLINGTGDATIGGAVTDAGSPVSHCMVRLYYRPTGTLIRSVFTDTSGLFSFTGLNAADTQNYFAVAFDPEGGVQYNAIIFDRLSAV